MKSAGKARSNGLYRHIRTSKEIIRNLLNDLLNKFKKSADRLSFLKKSALSSKRFLNLAAVRLEDIALAPDIF